MQISVLQVLKEALFFISVAVIELGEVRSCDWLESIRKFYHQK